MATRADSGADERVDDYGECAAFSQKDELKFSGARNYNAGACFETARGSGLGLAERDAARRAQSKPATAPGAQSWQFRFQLLASPRKAATFGMAISSALAADMVKGNSSPCFLR